MALDKKKTNRGEYSPQQFTITFKANKKENDLYNFIQSKFATGAYIKEILYREYLIETGQLTNHVNVRQNTPSALPQIIKQVEKEIEQQQDEGTKLSENNSWLE